ncbi:MAG: TM2 domain-containing protein, partial [Mailhella sp.]
MTQTFGELNVVVSQKERLVAFLLCFFLGVFGAHRFYAGRTLSAVSILVLNVIGWFTSFLGVGLVLIGIASFWVFIDFIINNI